MSNQPTYSKVPPNVTEIEKAVLGACLIQRDAFSEIAESISANCFYAQAHTDIFQAIAELSAIGQAVDDLTVVEQLKKNNRLESCGGAHYVTTLSSFVVSSAHIKHHCRLILESFMKRELIRIGAELTATAYENGADAFELLSQAEAALYNVRNRVEHKNYKDILTVMVETIKHLESIRHRDTHLTGVTSGFSELDRVTCGWQPTDLIILAARPSVGKTAFALNLARNAAKAVPVGFFSLEMSDRQLVQRVLSAESGILLWNLRNGKMGDDQMRQLHAKGIQSIASTKIFIDDTPNIKLSELKAKAKRMVNKDKVGIILVDYLQLIRTNGRHGGRKDLEIGEISSELKGLAKELNVPIIALSQLSRDVEKRGANEPKLSDLRESGAIEQDADMVMFLWRPSEAEIMDNAELAEFCNVKIEKHRNGTLEKFLGKFTKEIQKWDYLKVLDGSGMPAGSTWRPVSDIKSRIETGKDDEPF